MKVYTDYIQANPSARKLPTYFFEPASHIDGSNPVGKGFSLPHKELIVLLRCPFGSETVFKIKELAEEEKFICDFTVHSQGRYLNSAVIEVPIGFGVKKSAMDWNIKVLKFHTADDAENMKAAYLEKGSEYNTLNESICTVYLGYVSLFEEIIHRKDIVEGVEKKNLRVKQGRSGMQSFQTFSFIHLSKREETKTYEKGLKKVKWDFSWRVRGHWRSLNKNQKVGAVCPICSPPWR